MNDREELINQVARNNARMMVRWKGYVCCRNPDCHLIKATNQQENNIPNSLFRPLYPGQQYCCIECEHSHYRISTGRNYRLINQRLLNEWKVENQVK